MAKNLPWTPWHQVVKLREDVRTGELSLADFAADLHDVGMRKGTRPVYEDPARFFALTYPTLHLRDLARDVALRLSGKSTKAIRQLELTYGGGKTHALVTLHHLARDPESLPTLPAVRQFRAHIETPLPPARVAALCFDKLDVEKGMEVRDPAGKLRWLKHPWSVLAFQIAGEEGLRTLHPEGANAERNTPPAGPLLADLLARPQAQGLATLVLIDEVLMYVREKAAMDGSWRTRLIDFFQHLCQATARVDQCALVASLLASDPAKSDAYGKALTQEMFDIFKRQEEPAINPVEQQDVAEVLRRRFFATETISDPDTFRPHVTAAVANIAAIDEAVRKDRKSVEQRFLEGYPFHPDLTDVFYTKWTQLDRFQRTRGILRTFAIALRDAETWDKAPLVGPNVFLPEPGVSALAEAARELTGTATRELREAGGNDWSAVLEGELAKARALQDEQPALKHRELEQAVCATFLSSQPIGKKANTPDLMMLVSATRPDRIELEKGLRRWTEVSWFLDEAEFSGVQAAEGGPAELPKAWRLGNRPNLKQMHHDACANRVTAETVEQTLLTEVRRTKSLTQGAAAAGARVHTLPERPRDIEDDGEFHFAILGLSAVSESGKPNATARRFIDETTAADRPPHPPQCPSACGPPLATVWMPPTPASGSTSAGRRCAAKYKTSGRTRCGKGCSPLGRIKPADGYRMPFAKLGPLSSLSMKAMTSKHSRRRSAASPCSQSSRRIGVHAFRKPPSVRKRCCPAAPTISGGRTNLRAESRTWLEPSPKTRSCRKCFGARKSSTPSTGEFATARSLHR